MVSRVICLSLLVGMASAATWMGRLPLKPRELAHKQGCYIAEIDDVIPFGEAVSSPDQCYRIDCSRHMIYYESCGTVSTDDPKCYVTDYALNRPYPACCPDVKCEIDNNLF